METTGQKLTKQCCRHGTDSNKYCDHCHTEWLYRKSQTNPADLPTKATDTKQQFPTGAHRSSAEGRGRPQDLSPLALLRLGKLLERGANAYGARNYQKGMSMDRTAGSLLRHLLQYMSGDCDEDHLAAVMFNAMVLLDTDERVRTGLVPKEMKDI